MAYDPSTTRGQVRLLAVDRDEAAGFIFNDAEIDTFLLLEDQNVRRAAAMALETIASEEALIMKRITLLDLKTDGPATAKTLLDRAAKLREQADDAEAWEEGGGFDIAEPVDDVFGAREFDVKDALRDGE